MFISLTILFCDPLSSLSNEGLYLTFHRNISGYFFEYQSNVLGKFCRHVCGETRNPSIRPSSDKSRNFLGGLFLFQLNTCIISLLVNFQWCTKDIVNKSHGETFLSNRIWDLGWFWAGWLYWNQPKSSLIMLILRADFLCSHGQN